MSMHILRILLIIGGSLSLVLGIVGIFVPGLPTTPFLLLTAGMYLKSSDRLYNWVIKNKYFGHYIVNYKKNKGISRQVKIYSILMMLIMVTINIFFIFTSDIAKIILVSVAIIGIIVIIFWVPTSKKS